VTTRPDAATSLLDNSPLERIIVYQKLDSDDVSTRISWGAELDVSGPITTPVNPLPADSTAKPTPASAELGLSHRTFTLHIFPANGDNIHKEGVRRNPLHGQWPGDGKTDTFISAALRRVVPSGVMAPALRDWETGNQLTHDSDSFADNGREGAASMLLGKKRLSTREAFLMERIRRRGAEQETPKVMNSLIEFAEACRANPRPSVTQSEPFQDSAGEGSRTQTIDSPFETVPGTEQDGLLDNATFKKLLRE
jgi:hypothetical protein